MLSIFLPETIDLFSMSLLQTTLRLFLGNAAEGHLFSEVKLCS